MSSNLIRLIERRPEVVAAEPWLHLDDDAAVPNEGPFRVSVARYLGDEALQARAEAGVTIAPEDDVRELAAVVATIRLIAVSFPAFGDGRGYSHARILRDELGYTGALRAVGDVLHDQLWHMARCGFDEFELREDKDPNYAVQRAFSTWTEVYQPAADGRDAVLNRAI